LIKRCGWGLCVLIALAMAAPAGAGELPSIPCYPGGQVEMEALLTSEDLLPFLVESLSVEGAASPVARVLEGVTDIQILQMLVEGPVDQQQVIGFYGRIPQAEQMTRVFKQYDSAGSVTLVWSGPKGNGLFGLQIAIVRDQPADSSKVRIQVARLHGVVDVPTLLKELESDKLLPA